ncbi:MAG: MBL fold metallo-hydrolase [Thermoprotei archaeon]|nr:MAG: MBL fold metallo-hydrolase [Thermoprotei archaeon]
MNCVEAELTVLVDDNAGYVKGILGQHGFSVLVKVKDKTEKCYNILFDVGQDSKVLLHNANLLSINLNNVDSIAFSHRHYDHTGGICTLLKELGKRLPVVAHPDIGKPALIIDENKPRVNLNAGLPCSIAELKKISSLILTRSPLTLAPGVWWLGEIPRITSYEKGPRWSYTVSDDGELIRDPMKDDTGMAISIENYGTIVITGCSHSGIVNIITYASKVTGEGVRAIIGGLHLVDADDDVLEKTLNDLHKLGVKEVYAGHCTGIKAESLLIKSYNDKFNKIYTGYKMLFKVE